MFCPFVMGKFVAENAKVFRLYFRYDVCPVSSLDHDPPLYMQSGISLRRYLGFEDAGEMLPLLFLGIKDPSCFANAQQPSSDNFVWVKTSRGSAKVCKYIFKFRILTRAVDSLPLQNTSTLFEKPRLIFCLQLTTSQKACHLARNDCTIV